MTITITSFGLFVVVMLGYLAILSPILARREMAKLHRSVAHRIPDGRRRAYRRTIVAQWVSVAVLLGWWLLEGRSLTDMGLHFAASGWQWVALAVCGVATVLFALYFHRASGDAKSLADARAQLGPLVAMVPHTSAELRGFTWLSITAGVCEEIIYRGLLMTVLSAMVGLWPAVVLSSVVFGLGHAYQGAGGVVRTGLVGLVLALVVVLTGSLLMAMAMHAVLDMMQGRLMWAAVNGERAPIACPSPA